MRNDDRFNRNSRSKNRKTEMAMGGILEIILVEFSIWKGKGREKKE